MQTKNLHSPSLAKITLIIIIMHVKTDFDLQFSAGIHNSYNVFPSYWLNKEKKTYDSPTPVVKEDHSNFKVYTFTLQTPLQFSFLQRHLSYQP